MLCVSPILTLILFYTLHHLGTSYIKYMRTFVTTRRTSDRPTFYIPIKQVAVHLSACRIVPLSMYLCSTHRSQFFRYFDEICTLTPFYPTTNAIENVDWCTIPTPHKMTWLLMLYDENLLMIVSWHKNYMDQIWTTRVCLLDPAPYKVS